MNLERTHFMVNCRFAISSLGCAKNLVDSERIAGNLQNAGYPFTQDYSQAEIIIVNTCAFIEGARNETIQEILCLAEYKKTGNCRLLIATGCFSERYGENPPEELSDVDLFINLKEANKIAELIHGLIPPAFTRPQPEAIDRLALTLPHSAYLKISDGCDNRCSYCAIPLIRGPYGDFPMASLITEAVALEKRGVQEMILIGQDTTLYGANRTHDGLIGLLRGILAHTSIPWIRILYTHPAHWSRKLMEFMAAERRICPYVDLPLQHISDPILSAMGRKTDSSRIQNLIAELRSVIPGLTLRTTFLVGFPGETQKDFQLLCDFTEKIQFDRMGVFPFSREKNTPAFWMKPQIPLKVAEKRAGTLMRLQESIMLHKNRSQIGKEICVLVDGRCNPMQGFGYRGRTQADAPDVDGIVYLKGEDLKSGEWVQAKVTDANPVDFFAVVLKKGHGPFA